MLDPHNASVVYTPLDLRNRLHPTVGRLLILPADQVASALDPAPASGDHLTAGRPCQANTFSEAVPVVPDGEADPLRGAMLTALRLISLDGLDANRVLSAFGAHVQGWAEALPDGRLRGRQRMARG